MLQLHSVADPQKLKGLFAYNRRAVMLNFEDRFGMAHAYRHRDLIHRILLCAEEEELAAHG